MIDAVTLGLRTVQASPTWAGVRPISAATSRTTSAMARLRSVRRPRLELKLLRVPSPDASFAAVRSSRLYLPVSTPPAMLMNHRYDILAWNHEMTRLLLDFDTLPPSQRNSTWLCLMHPEIREFHVDRERLMREGITHQRVVIFRAADDESRSALDRLCTVMSNQPRGNSEQWNDSVRPVPDGWYGRSRLAPPDGRCVAGAGLGRPRVGVRPPSRLSRPTPCQSSVSSGVRRNERMAGTRSAWASSSR